MESVPPSVILVLVGVGSDALSCYGAELGATPVLDGFASSARRYAECSASGPDETSVFASLVTGLTAREHGLFASAPLRPQLETLAEALGARGFATASVHSLPPLCGARGDLMGGFQSAEAIALVPGPEDGAAVTDGSLAWWDAQRDADRPKFLLVAYPPGDAGAAVDEEVGRLFAGLRERGAYDSSVVVLTSHRMGNVPLIMKGRGQDSGDIGKGAASVADVPGLIAESLVSTDAESVRAIFSRTPKHRVATQPLKDSRPR